MVDVGYDNDLLLRLSNSCDSNEARAKLLEKASLLEARMTGSFRGSEPPRFSLGHDDSRSRHSARADGAPGVSCSTEDDDEDDGDTAAFAVHSHGGEAKKRKVFSREEDDAIVEGVKRHGLDWDAVVAACGLDRTAKQVQARWKRIQKSQGSGAHFSPMAGDGGGGPAAGGSPMTTIGFGGKGVVGAAVDAGKVRSNTISRYFAKMDEDPQGSQGFAAGQHSNGFPTPPPPDRPLAPRPPGREFSAQTALSGEAVAAALEAHEGAPELRAELKRLGERLTEAQRAAEDAQRGRARLQQALDEAKHLAEKREAAGRALMTEVAIEGARREREEARSYVQQMALRLGTVGVQRAGAHLTEVWEDGSAQRELADRQRGLAGQREAVEAARKALKRRLPPPGSEPGAAEESNGLYVTSDEYLAREEAFKVRMLVIKRDEDALARDRDRVDSEKSRYIRELKRMKDEDASRFNGNPVMHGRYVLLNLLGKGGFSEVYKAVDLVEHRIVACKVHQLNSQWREAKKQSYVRHAVREYNIHRTLVHPKVVRLYDTFEVDSDTFCTVLEYCGGQDLDVHVKKLSMLPEREVKCIVAQIFEGLSYLNSSGRRIIHYDLKPGNILFDDTGGVKITDFGLSKIMEESVATSDGMELTSQGAGTYWYLPPECFEVGHAPPKVSSKVDVWSVGVIMFQLLYGRRPFGHDLTQEKILRDEAILRADEVEFPARPAVSSEAKVFMRKLLRPRQEERLDVHGAREDPYLSFRPKSKA